MESLANIFHEHAFGWCIGLEFFFPLKSLTLGLVCYSHTFHDIWDLVELHSGSKRACGHLKDIQSKA